MPRTPAPIPDHGTPARRGRGCDCRPCKDAGNAQVRASRARKAQEDAAWEAWKNQWLESP